MKAQSRNACDRSIHTHIQLRLHARIHPCVCICEPNFAYFYAHQFGVPGLACSCVCLCVHVCACVWTTTRTTLMCPPTLVNRKCPRAPKQPYVFGAVCCRHFWHASKKHASCVVGRRQCEQRTLLLHGPVLFVVLRDGWGSNYYNSDQEIPRHWL